MPVFGGVPGTLRRDPGVEPECFVVVIFLIWPPSGGSGRCGGERDLWISLQHDCGEVENNGCIRTDRDRSEFHSHQCSCAFS